MSVRTVTPEDKSFPHELRGREVSALDAPLTAFSTPLLAVQGDDLRHNLRLMARWCEQRGLELMPHGKTTMAPVLWHRQLAAGASGITVATGWQADVALRAGVPVVQLAAQCLDPGLLRRLADRLAEHPEQELVCWADSLRGVEILESVLADADAGTEVRIGVLAELGAEGGRTGARSAAGARAVAERAAASPRLALRGVAGYEGALGHDRGPTALAAVGDYCARLADLGADLAPLAEGPAWITAGGSAYPDLVAERIAGVPGTRPIVRPGAYVVHDHGFYRGISPLDRDRGLAPEQALLPAMRGFARVISRPEPGLALLDAGKRDLPCDEGLPVVLGSAPSLGAPAEPLDAEVTALNDQHLFLRVAPEARLEVGDVVTLGPSHPCTAFDKWRLVPVVESDGQVREALETFF